MHTWQTFLNAYPVTNDATQHASLLIDLSPLALLKVDGEGAKKLLQGQLTCDLDEITPEQSRLGAHCNPQGRIISLFRLFLYRGNYYIQLPQDLFAAAFTALKKYAPFFKATLSNTSEDLVRIGYVGEQLQQFLPGLPEQPDEMVTLNDVLIIKLPGKVSRYELIGEFDKLSALWQQLAEHATIATFLDWKAQDMAAGIPAIYADTTEKFLPHDLNLQELNAISFKKGCYTGQEIIARMQYRGKLKNHLYLVSVTTHSTPERGQDIYRGTDRAGIIVDVCPKNLNHYALLIVAQEADVQAKSLLLDPISKAPLAIIDR